MDQTVLDPLVNNLTKEIKVLLLRLKTYEDSSCYKQIILDVMKKIINLCLSKSSAKDILRTVGGLSLLTEFVCCTSDPECLENGLQVLSSAIDQNAFNQMEITKGDIFLLLCCTLRREDATPSLLKSSILLISTLLFQNGIAQNMFNELGCLQCCINLYEEIFPSFMLGCVSVKSNNTEKELVSTELWQAVNTVLCFSMTNPINESNQERCSKLLPVTLKLLQCCSYSEIASSVLSFLSSLIIDNAKNRDLLIEHDGLTVLEHCLEVGVMSIIANKDKDLSKGDLLATIKLIGLIDLCITGNENIVTLLSKTCIVSLMSRLLFVCSLLDDSSKTTILLTLGHFIEADSANIKFILAEGNLKEFFQESSTSSNDDVLRGCQYVIHLMLKHGCFESKDLPSNHPSNAEEIKWYSEFPEDGDSCVTKMHERMQKMKTSTIASSSSESSHAESELRLRIVKEDRVQQYLQNLEMYKLRKNSAIASSQSDPKNNTHSEVSLGVKAKAKKVKYFTKKLGNHVALTKLTDKDTRAKNENRSLVETIDLTTDTNKDNHLHCCMDRCNSSKSCCCLKVHSSCQKFSKPFCNSGSCARNKAGTSTCGLFKVPPATLMQTSTPLRDKPCRIFDKSFNRSSFSAASNRTNNSLFINARRKKMFTSSFLVPDSRKMSDKGNDSNKRKKRVINKKSKSVCSATSATVPNTSIDVMNFTLSSEPPNKKLAGLALEERKQDMLKAADSSFFTSDDPEPFFDILVFPAEKCQEHGLISSTERVWYSPLEEKF